MVEEGWGIKKLKQKIVATVLAQLKANALHLDWFLGVTQNTNIKAPSEEVDCCGAKAGLERGPHSLPNT